VSLTARLSAFFLAALAVVLVGFSLTLYLLARAYLHRQAQERLTAALDTMAVAAEVDPRGVEWDTREHPLPFGRDTGPDQVRWAVHDGHGRPVDHSANLSPEDPLDRESLAGLAEGPAVRSADRAGRPWCVARRRVEAVMPLQGPPEPGRYEALVLTAGLSLEPTHATLRTLALALAALSLGVWAGAALVGRRVCRRALAPVTRMAEAAHAMGAADLGRRLPSPGTGDELEEMREAFNDLLGRLQEAFERQRRFTGDASHQLRTPLTVLLGQVEVSLRRDRPAGEYRSVLELVRGQATHLRQIVEALLFLARADAEAELAALEAVDLAAWLPEHLGRWAGHARSADLRVEGPGGPLGVRAQPVLLGQLVDCLVDNALKYSAPGTPVTVRLRREGGAAVLEVEDSGCGIGSDDLARVFEPFFRAEPARRSGRAGVGLGLAVARRIAGTFRGSLEVESRAGEGSRFLLRLPAEEAGQDGVPPQAVPQQGAQVSNR
jgi:heavy metal sensor kinase